MRSRSNQIPASKPYGATYALDRRDGSSAYSGSPGFYTYYSLDECMEDETPRHKRTGSVRHVRIQTDLSDHDPVLFDDGTYQSNLAPPSYWRYIGGHGSNWVSKFHFAALSRPTVNDYTAFGALRSAADAGTLAGFTWPTVDLTQTVLDLQRSETKVDLLVNLIEAGQLKSLCKEGPKLARSLIGHLQNSSQVLRKVSWRARGKALYEATGDAANLFLGYSFGLKPLLGDIMSFRREIQNASDSIAREKARANKPHTWRKPIVSTQPSSNYGPWSSYMWYSQKLWNHQPTTISSVRYIDELRFPDSIVSDIGIMARRLGIVPRFEAAWELVPFSFVVDWCFGIGQLAQLLDNKVGYLKKRNILECAVSRKYVYTRLYYWDHPNAVQPGQYPCGSSLVSFYDRSTVTPPGISLPEGSGFGKMKAAITAALLRQRKFGKIQTAAAKTAFALSKRASAIRRLDRAHPRRRVYEDLQQCYQLVTR